MFNVPFFTPGRQEKIDWQLIQLASVPELEYPRTASALYSS